jgi:hypothetical protein
LTVCCDGWLAAQYPRAGQMGVKRCLRSIHPRHHTSCIMYRKNNNIRETCPPSCSMSITVFALEFKNQRQPRAGQAIFIPRFQHAMHTRQTHPACASSEIYPSHPLPRLGMNFHKRSRAYLFHHLPTSLLTLAPASLGTSSGHPSTVFATSSKNV